jgi:hypothetical protein
MDIRNEIAKHKIDNRGQTYVPLTLALRIANERVNRKREEDAREIEALEMIQGVLEDALLDVMPLVKRFNFTLWVTTMRRIGAVIDPRVMHELVGLEEPGMVTRQYENRPQPENPTPEWVKLLDERANDLLARHIRELEKQGRINPRIVVDQADHVEGWVKLRAEDYNVGHDPYNNVPPVRK